MYSGGGNSRAVCLKTYIDLGRLRRLRAQAQRVPWAPRRGEASPCMAPSMVWPQGVAKFATVGGRVLRSGPFVFGPLFGALRFGPVIMGVDPYIEANIETHAFLRIYSMRVDSMRICDHRASRQKPISSPPPPTSPPGVGAWRRPPRALQKVCHAERGRWGCPV